MNFSLHAFAQLLLEIAASRATEVRAFEWMEAAIRKVDSDYRNARQLCQSGGYDQGSATVVSYGLRALEEYREALALVEDYFSEGGAGYLQEAARLAASAQHKMDAACVESQKVSDLLGCDWTS